jgi:hypothetical protein
MADQAQAGSMFAGGGGGTTSTAEAAPFYLDDLLPWFDSEGDADFPDGMQDVVLHLSAEGTPARATLSTHLPSGGLETAKALLFSARASQPVRLLVSVGHNQRGYDYFSDTVPWPLATVDVGQQWEAFSIDRADFAPAESEQDRALAGFYIAFIVEAVGRQELWFDDVTFRQ